MTTLYIATGNAGKLREIADMARQYLPQYDRIIGRAARDAPETAPDFAGNAWIKARALCAELLSENQTDFAVLADDSGLEVDLLGGQPGVHSARYAGDHVDPAQHMQKLLRELAPWPRLEDRVARYQCALALIEVRDGTRREFFGQGACEGLIAFLPTGESGFGYDPIFYSPRFGKSFSELAYDEKNSISHRRQAFDALARQIATR